MGNPKVAVQMAVLRDEREKRKHWREQSTMIVLTRACWRPYCDCCN